MPDCTVCCATTTEFLPPRFKILVRVHFVLESSSSCQPRPRPRLLPHLQKVEASDFKKVEIFSLKLPMFVCLMNNSVFALRSTDDGVIPSASVPTLAVASE